MSSKEGVKNKGKKSTGNGQKQDYNQMSLKQCEGKLKALNKTLADLNKQTDPKKFEQAKKAKSQEINSLKVRSAEIKWKMEARQTEKTEVVRAQDQRRKALKESHEQLDGYVQGRRKATETLKSNFGGRRIKKPDEHLKTLKSQLRAANASLKTEALSNQEEKQLHRKIKDLKASVAQTEKYIRDNVSQLYDQQDQKKQEMNEFMGSHTETQAQFEKAKANADKLFKDLSDLRDERESIAADIKMLSEEKNGIISKYNASMKQRNDTERDIARCKRAIDDKKLERSMQSVSGPKPAEKKKKVEKKQEKKEEEVQSAVPVVSLDERRKAAIAAYEAMQKEKEQKVSAQTTAESSPVKVESTQAPELNEDAKLCQILIALCQNMKPKQSTSSPSKSKKSKKKKRKQKKMRLTHAPDTFSNFARLGVNIPVWTQDLDDTISALKERLEQCSGNEEKEN